MNPLLEYHNQGNRRLLLQGAASSIGVAALSALMSQDATAETSGPKTDRTHFFPRAKRVVYLFQSGGPSQLELFDEKPELRRLEGGLVVSCDANTIATAAVGALRPEVMPA